jgi:hypothetical protein
LARTGRHYSAPERISEEQITVRGDGDSLGFVLAFLATGRHVFDAREFKGLFRLQ